MGKLFKEHRFAANLGVQVVLFVVLLVAGSFFGGGSAEESFRKVEGQVVASYGTPATAPPDGGSVQRAEATAKSLGQSVELLESRLRYRVAAERGPTEVTDRNDFAKALLTARQELLDAPTGGRIVPFPDDLGFGNQLPDPAALPAALVQLDLVVHIIKMAIEAGVHEIAGVDLSASPDATGGAYLTDVPVRFRILGPSEAIARLLADLDADARFVALRGADLKSRAGADQVELAATLAALQINEGEAVDKQFGTTGPSRGPAGSGAPSRTIDDLFRRR